jgi:hypothetical protein
MPFLVSCLKLSSYGNVSLTRLVVKNVLSTAIKVYRRAFAIKGKHAFYMRRECREPKHLW